MSRHRTGPTLVFALIQAARLLKSEELEKRADRLVRRLWDLFWDGRSLARSFSRGNNDYLGGNSPFGRLKLED